MTLPYSHFSKPSLRAVAILTVANVHSSFKPSLPSEIWLLILQSIITISTLANGSLDLTPDSALWTALTKDAILAECMFQSIITVSTLANGSLDLTPDSALWTALTKDAILAECTKQQLLLQRDPCFSADARLEQFPDVNLLALIFMRPGKMVVHTGSPTTLQQMSEQMSDPDSHMQFCYWPSIQRSKNAMRKTREAVKLAMKQSVACSNPGPFVLPHKLELDCVGATCDCGKFQLPQKVVLKPLVKILSGTWNTTRKPVDVNVLHETVVPDVDDKFSPLPKKPFTYW
jgi:ribosomal protein L32